MTRMRRVALALMFAGGLAVSAPASAYAGGGGDPQGNPGVHCIICWPTL